MYVYLLDYAEKELKFSSTDATYLLSVIGIINTVGEVLIGWIGDQQWTNLNALYAICMLACGISTALVPFLTIYRSLAIVAGKYYMTMHKLHHLIEFKICDICNPWCTNICFEFKEYSVSRFLQTIH